MITLSGIELRIWRMVYILHSFLPPDLFIQSSSQFHPADYFGDHLGEFPVLSTPGQQPTKYLFTIIQAASGIHGCIRLPPVN